MGVTRYVLPFLSITTVILGIANGKDEVLVRSCPQDKSSWDTAARRKECKPEGGQNYEYHCVKNERQELVETCMVAQWIEKGVCPVLFDSGSFGAESCTSRTFLGPCPTMVYRSNEVYTFLLCFVSTTMTTSTTRTTTQMKITVPTRSPVEEKETTIPIPDDGGKIAGIILGILFATVVAGIVVWKYRSQIGSRIRSWTKCIEQDAESGPEHEEETVPLRYVTDNQQTLKAEAAQAAAASKPEKRNVQLAAYAEGVDILKKNGVIVITGKMGSGKTTAIQRIIKMLQEEDTEWKVEGISTWKENYNPTDKLLIQWDDCFGRFVVNLVKKNSIKEKIEAIIKWVDEKKDSRRLILSMRDPEFSSFNVSTLVDAKFKVDLDGITEENKTKFMEYYCIQDKMKGNVAAHEHSSIGFPLICKLATIPYVAENFSSFSINPFSCAMSLLDDLKVNNRQLYCAMIYMLFKGGQTDLTCTDSSLFRQISEIIPPVKNEDQSTGGKTEKSEYQNKDLSNELRTIFNKNSQYFLKEKEENFRLQHNIVLLWLLCHFYNRFRKVTIDLLDFDILLELLRPPNYDMERHEEDIGMLGSFYLDVKYGHNKERTQSASDSVSQKPEERSKTEIWKFILEENMYDSFLDRVRKQIGIVEATTDKISEMLKDHPLLDNDIFKAAIKKRTAYAVITLDATKP